MDNNTLAIAFCLLALGGVCLALGLWLKGLG